MQTKEDGGQNSLGRSKKQEWREEIALRNT